jgi:hypothetical protein
MNLDDLKQELRALGVRVTSRSRSIVGGKRIYLTLIGNNDAVAGLENKVVFGRDNYIQRLVRKYYPDARVTSAGYLPSRYNITMALD